MKKYMGISAFATLSLAFLASCGQKKKHVENEAPGKEIAIPVESERPKKMEQVKTSSGLTYQVLQAGSGATPEKGKKVTVHYTGWLEEDGQVGKKFDSSVDRGEPFSFVIGVGQVIKGWDEGVMGMKVGEKRRLFIPSDLGYGSRGAGRIIPPNATLIFDVELIKVG